MKRLIYLVSGLLACVSSCDIEHIDNGKLDGLWKLQAMDSLGTSTTVDMSRTNMAYAVQGNLLQLHPKQLYFRFDHTGDSLILHDPYINLFDVSKPLTNIEEARPFGVNNFREAFHVDELSRGKLVLSTEILRLHFEKY